jgi:hypothetical protein
MSSPGARGRARRYRARVASVHPDVLGWCAPPDAAPAGRRTGATGRAADATAAVLAAAAAPALTAAATVALPAIALATAALLLPPPVGPSGAAAVGVLAVLLVYGTSVRAGLAAALPDAPGATPGRALAAAARGLPGLAIRCLLGTVPALVGLLTAGRLGAPPWGAVLAAAERTGPGATRRRRARLGRGRGAEALAARGTALLLCGAAATPVAAAVLTIVRQPPAGSAAVGALRLTLLVALAAVAGTTALAAGDVAGYLRAACAVDALDLTVAARAVPPAPGGAP